MRRLTLIFLILALINATAFCESVQEYNFISFGDEGYPVGAFFRIIGFTSVYYDAPSDDDEPVFTNSALEYLTAYQSEHGLEATGCFDSETALYITADMEPEISTLVWIPMHGGHKYHNDPECSNMIGPREIPKSAALALDFTYCKRCWKNGDPEVTN